MDTQQTQEPTSDEAVIRTLAVEKMNLEIENIRLKHALAAMQKGQQEGAESA